MVVSTNRPESLVSHSEVSVEGAQTRSQGHRVLWIDDQCEDAAVLLLKLEGFIVDVATTAEAGVSMACAGRYDGIVLDKCLPDGSGIAVLQQLRSRGVDAPVMLLTGFGDIESAVTAMRLGAFDYRQKPLMGDEWLDSVRRLVHARAGSATALVTHDADVPTPATEPVPLVIEELRELVAQDSDPAKPAAALLTRVVSRPTLGIPEFVGCAEMLRRLLSMVSSVFKFLLGNQTENVMRHRSVQWHCRSDVFEADRVTRWCA